MRFSAQSLVVLVSMLLYKLNVEASFTCGGFEYGRVQETHFGGVSDSYEMSQVGVLRRK